MCQIWFVCSRIGMRMVSRSASALSKRHNSTPVACALNRVKFTPLPIQVAPSG